VVVTTPSKSAVNRAGQTLIDKSATNAELSSAQEVVNIWRALHGDPINTFQNTLRYRLNRMDKSAVVAQRLKRTSSIASKLRRLKGMQLARMQDIGGVRGVLSDMAQVRAARQLYEEPGRFDHQIVSADDYIQFPKRDGYRSVHLVFRYKNISNPIADGLFVELQLRTRLQHAWATAVETMGTFLGQELKSRQGDSHWLRFFELTSSAFAHIEGCPLIPAWRELDFNSTCIAIRDADLQLKMLAKLQGFSAAIKTISAIQNESTKSYYHLVELDSLRGELLVTPYAKLEFDRANSDYLAAERRALAKKMDVFLVSAGPIALLRTAYPNFFMDTKVFIREVRQLTKNGSLTRGKGRQNRLLLPRGQGYLDF
jgi:putative GTP pyrophosphokinase